MIAERAVFARFFRCHDESGGGARRRDERLSKTQRLTEVSPKLRSRADARVDGFVRDDRQRGPDRERRFRRGGLSPRGGSRCKDGRRQDDGVAKPYEAFFSAAAAASAAARFPCSINAFTFWPPFCPISS